MSEQKMPDMDALRQLHTQIEEVCKHFKQIRGEAKNIVSNSQMPDATLHLNDVLHSTEQATNAVLDAATNIGYAIDSVNVPADIKQKVNDDIGRIYEACSFQDISGQRIKKVLEHMNTLETQLSYLAQAAKGEVLLQKIVDPLLNGPQLSGKGPNQQDVDQLFSKAK